MQPPDLESTKIDSATEPRPQTSRRGETVLWLCMIGIFWLLALIHGFDLRAVVIASVASVLFAMAWFLEARSTDQKASRVEIVVATNHAPSSVAEFEAAQARWNKVFYGYLPYIGIGFLLALTIPDEGATSPLMRSLIESVGDVVPSIDRLAKLSPFPGMTRTFGALMWLIYPAFTVWGLLRAPRIPHLLMTWPRLLFGVPAAAACMVVLLILVPFFFPGTAGDRLGYLQGRGAAGLTFIVTSRVGHGTLGSLMFAASSFSLVVVCCLARDWPRLIAQKFRIPHKRPSPDTYRSDG